MFPILLELIEEGKTNKQKVVLKFFVQSQLSAMLDLIATFRMKDTNIFKYTAGSETRLVRKSQVHK
jgi:hypothetical protein